MRRSLLATVVGTTALFATAVLAQTPMEAPAPRTGPANICQEVVAFLKTPPPAPAAAPAPAPPPAATGPAPQAAQTGSNVPQGGGAPAVEAQKAPPPAGQNATPPQTAGITAPVPQAPPAPKAPPVSLAQAESLASAKTLRAAATRPGPCGSRASRFRPASSPWRRFGRIFCSKPRNRRPETRCTGTSVIVLPSSALRQARRAAA